MGKRTFLIAVLSGISTVAISQTSYLARPDLMAISDSCLTHTYGFSFTKARQFQQRLEGSTPNHPAPPFLEALILYWEEFPLTPDHPHADRFVELMDQSVARAARLIGQEHTYLEGIFFDLFGRAFKAMYWADNGKAAKVVPDLRTMYNHTKTGFDLKEEFSEFYFSTGLYNYYIEAYPEAHPVYKPLVSFMQEGDRTLGLIQLSHAIRHTVYLRVEALLFMSLIQLNYEDDLQSAAFYAERLYELYPKNIYYQGHMVTIWLHQKHFEKVRSLLEKTEYQDDRYSRMMREMALAFMSEERDPDDAGKRYRESIRLAGSLGPIADIFAAISYMGLSRLHAQKGFDREARQYARKAAGHTVYPFVLNETGAGPR